LIRRWSCAGWLQTRSRARQLIESGFVSVNDTKTTKTSKLITASDHLTVSGEAAAYVSRAAGKLIAGLDQFGIDPKGLGVWTLAHQLAALRRCWLSVARQR
jgi:predicted rRNA methylase YqxC with S4 and FtsJ domains